MKTDTQSCSIDGLEDQAFAFLFARRGEVGKTGLILCSSSFFSGPHQVWLPSKVGGHQADILNGKRGPEFESECLGED